MSGRLKNELAGNACWDELLVNMGAQWACHTDGEGVSQPVRQIEEIIASARMRMLGTAL